MNINNAREINIKKLDYDRGKYFAGDCEVYVYNPLGNKVFTVGVKSTGGEIPGSKELVTRTLPEVMAGLMKEQPRIASQLNGLLILGGGKYEKKEQVRNGGDVITVEQRGEVKFQLVRYIQSSGKNRSALEDIFGDIF